MAESKAKFWHFQGPEPEDVTRYRKMDPGRKKGVEFTLAIGKPGPRGGRSKVVGVAFEKAKFKNPSDGKKRLKANNFTGYEEVKESTKYGPDVLTDEVLERWNRIATDLE